MSETQRTPGPWAIFKCEGISTVMPAGRPGDIADNITNDRDADLIAAAPDMLAALHATRKLVTEAALTGFNCHDGEWAERLFANQANISAAIAKAEGKL